MNESTKDLEDTIAEKDQTQLNIRDGFNEEEQINFAIAEMEVNYGDLEAQLLQLQQEIEEQPLSVEEVQHVANQTIQLKVQEDQLMRDLKQIEEQTWKEKTNQESMDREL